MKRPDTMTLFMGHPFVGVPMSLAVSFGAYVAWDQGNPIVAVVALAALAKLGTAIEHVRAYRAWRRAWEAMDPDAPQRRAAVRVWWAGALFGTLLVALFVAKPETMPLAAIGLGSLAAIVAILALVGAVLRMTRRRTRHRPFAVRVVARSVMPVPSLADAYQALPGYCQTLLVKRP